MELSSPASTASSPVVSCIDSSTPSPLLSSSQKLAAALALSQCQTWTMSWSIVQSFSRKTGSDATTSSRTTARTLPSIARPDF
ncbi:hypothetical protein LINPERPRIM_LOCUS26838 [Linum perenne]